MADLNSTIVRGKLRVTADEYISGNLNVTGTLTGNGSGLTSLNGSNISSGTVAFARLPTGTGANQVAIGNHTHGSYATDNAVVHKGTSSSPSNEDIYGTKTFKSGGIGFYSDSYPGATGMLTGVGYILVFTRGDSGPAYLNLESSSHGTLAFGHPGIEENCCALINATGGNDSRAGYLLFPAVGTESEPKTIATRDDLTSFVTGPSSATDNGIALFDGTTGKLIKDSGYFTITGNTTGVSITGTNTQQGSIKLGTLHSSGVSYAYIQKTDGTYTGHGYLILPNVGGTSFATAKTLATTDDIPSTYAGSSSAGGAANSVANSLTFNNGGSGAASGTTFNGSAAKTISYNTIGAAASNHNHDSVYAAKDHAHSQYLTSHQDISGKVDKWSEISNTDLNTVTTPGFYRLNTGNSNTFTSSEYGQLLVVRGGGDTIAQLGFPYSSSRAYIRCGNPVGNASGTWRNWYSIALTGESQPASDVYAWAKAASKPSYTASEVGAVATTGDTMTGSLTVQVSDASLTLNNTSSYARLHYYGTFGITFNNTTNPFEVTTDGKVYGSSFYATSDRRLKDNILNPNINYLDILNEIKLKEFIFKENTNKNSNSKYLGVIAQQVYGVLPNKFKDTIVQHRTDKMLTVDEGKIHYLTMGAVQQLSKKVDKQEKEIDKLKQENKELRQLIKEMNKKLNKLIGGK